MRKLVVGDIHGGLLALQQVLERVELQSEDHLIFLGDYVDGWSDSAPLIDYLITLSKSYSCEFILGNHDSWCIDWLENGVEDAVWIKHGGKETKESYAGYSMTKRKAHLKFFGEMKSFIIDQQNRLFVHAGFSSMHGPIKEHHADSFQWDRTLWETALAVHEKVQKDDKTFPKRLNLFDEIYIGHTPTINWDVNHPWQRCNLWNIDTGAAFNGKLSVMDIDTKEYWQSDDVMSLYPNEKGRN